MMEDDREMTEDAAAALIALVVGFALGMILAWIYWFQRDRKPEPSRATVGEEERVTLEPQPEAIDFAPSVGVEDDPEPDDLTRVEGVGPKMSGVLAEAGVVSFEQLAATDPETLREILREEGLQFADPTTWPEQAALAAVGAWQALEELQEELSGGRRVG